MLKNLLNLLPAPIVRKIGDSSFANLEERGAISTWMVATPKNETDADDWGDFDIDDFDFDPSAEISDTASTDAYIDRQISKIPQFGDGARWRLADYLNMFDDLSRDGSLTDEQREAVDNFVAGYQLDRFKPDECCGCEMDFPESQYVALGLDLETAQKLGDTYRAGECIPQIGHEAVDRISNRLNQMQSENRRTALRK